ncbi:MAG TPA: acetyl-CoA carboxylase biotin carboxylase subunit, partial [Ignavibacteriaceae bacterium]|nr:acetyl-CoA carboxylase biotin carboxylase subunit [Ignavibacteriaceae bacterium]
GNYRHVFERECSIQRRHQKIIEEAPSSFLDEKTREKITSTAIQAAKACGYFNAGTIEFLMDSNKEFYFLEMNTRIQVEHPVTELISGIDLVKEQILISADNKISFEQKDIKLNGYALECRIYAEDPENNFFPSTGKILNYKEPNGIGTRVDSGFATDSEISIHYDPMIAKLICWDNNRSKAISRMNRALDEFQIAGITTNIRFLKFILNTNEFKKGKYDINFIDNLNYSGLTDQSLNNKSDNESAAAVFAALIKSKQKSSSKKNIMVKDNKWWEQNYE